MIQVFRFSGKMKEIRQWLAMLVAMNPKMTMGELAALMHRSPN